MREHLCVPYVGVVTKKHSRFIGFIRSDRAIHYLHNVKFNRALQRPQTSVTTLILQPRAKNRPCVGERVVCCERCVRVPAAHVSPGLAVVVCCGLAVNVNGSILVATAETTIRHSPTCSVACPLSRPSSSVLACCRRRAGRALGPAGRPEWSSG